MVTGFQKHLKETELRAFARSSPESDLEYPATVATKSRKHSIFTHFPEDRDCDVCLGTKITRAFCRRRTGEALPRAEKCGALLDERWWSDSMECYCYLRNIQDLLRDWKTLYGRRFGESFKGPITPFGALIEYHPISRKDQSRIHQFGKKVLPGIFLGCELIAAKIWKGDILEADLEDLEKLD